MSQVIHKTMRIANRSNKARGVQYSTIEVVFDDTSYPYEDKFYESIAALLITDEYRFDNTRIVVALVQGVKYHMVCMSADEQMIGRAELTRTELDTLATLARRRTALIKE